MEAGDDQETLPSHPQYCHRGPQQVTVNKPSSLGIFLQVGNPLHGLHSSAMHSKGSTDVPGKGSLTLHTVVSHMWCYHSEVSLTVRVVEPRVTCACAVLHIHTAMLPAFLSVTFSDKAQTVRGDSERLLSNSWGAARTQEPTSLPSSPPHMSTTARAVAQLLPHT